MTTKKKPVNGCRKGKAGELAACKFLHSLGFHDAERTEQHCGRSGEIGDIQCRQTLTTIHFEVKLVKGMTIGNGLFEQAIAQAKRDCPHGKYWVVLWRRFGSSSWLMTCPIWGGVATFHRAIDIKDQLNAYQMTLDGQ